ncbi:MAG: DegV family protein [Thermoleophilia bacterium]
MDPGRLLEASSTALLIDSSADVPAAARPANWRVVPIPVAFGDEAFEDGVDLDPAGFYARLARAQRLPTTAQPSVARIAGVLRAALDEFASVVVLPLSARMSGTVDAARAAAAQVDRDRVLVLESGTVTVGLGLLALRVQARLEHGRTAAEIEAAVAALRGAQRAVFSLETLEFLQRGGRVGRAQAVAGSLLRVRPILQIEGGEVAPWSRVRGAHRVLPALGEYLAAYTRDDRPLHVALAHSQRPEVLPRLRDLVAEVRPHATIDLEGEVGPTVGTHCGPGAFVVAFVHDPPG